MLYLIITGRKIVLALKVNRVVERTKMLSVLTVIVWHSFLQSINLR